MNRKGIFSSLFDLSFTEFVTTRLVKFTYGLIIFIAGLAALIATISGFSQSAGVGILALVLSLSLFLLCVIIARIGLETILVIFNIAEHARSVVKEMQRENHAIED